MATKSLNLKETVSRLYRATNLHRMKSQNDDCNVSKSKLRKTVNTMLLVRSRRHWPVRAWTRKMTKTSRPTAFFAAKVAVKAQVSLDRNKTVARRTMQITKVVVHRSLLCTHLLITRRKQAPMLSKNWLTLKSIKKQKNFWQNLKLEMKMLLKISCLTRLHWVSIRC